MPFSTEMINDGTGILRRGTGVVTGQEVLEQVRQLPTGLLSPELVTHGIVDLSEATAIEASTRELRELIELDRRRARLLGPLHVAIVAPKDLAYGLSRMYHAMTRNPDWTMNIFRSRPEADAWLKTVLPRRRHEGSESGSVPRP